jgi:tRNA (guanine-N7-)-methyltransferase
MQSSTPQHPPCDSRPPIADSGGSYEWKPQSIVERADLSAVFGRRAPLEVDFGCGEGAFLLQRARNFPERNFLGTERLAGRVEKVCRGVARERLQNVRLLRLESAYTVEYLLPAESVALAHVLFPDPWPKRAHQSRRLIQDGFVEAVRRALEPGGLLHLKTDDLPYFQWMLKVMERAHGWTALPWPETCDFPTTNFEARFLAQGLPIHRALYQRTV